MLENGEDYIQSGKHWCFVCDSESMHQNLGAWCECPLDGENHHDPKIEVFYSSLKQKLVENMDVFVWDSVSMHQNLVVWCECPLDGQNHHDPNKFYAYLDFHNRP